MDLLIELELGRKYGQTFTFQGTKYSLEDFIDKLSEETFYNEVRQSIIDKINHKILVEDESKDQEVES
jgi:hypothetical protein